MISHELKIGQRIFDTRHWMYGKVLLIGGEEKDRVLSKEDTDVIVTYRPDNSTGESEVMADRAYPIVEGKTFRGEEVFLEILRDEFTDGRDYNYYCPDYNENCFDFETD